MLTLHAVSARAILKAHKQGSIPSHLTLSFSSSSCEKRVLRCSILMSIEYFFARFDEAPKCAFSKESLNFAIHVRMGDRRKFFDKGNDRYFQLLEAFMGTISAGVTQRGLLSPVFHIFSESLRPCPSETTGLFEEFPTWPVELDQVSRSSKEHEKGVYPFCRFIGLCIVISTEPQH